MTHAYSTRRHDTHARTHMTHARTHTHIQLHSRARTLAQTLTRSTRSLHRPACCLQSPAVVESAADACLDPRIDKSPQSAAAPLFAQQTNNCSKLCPMDVAVTSVRRSDRMHRFADSDQACPSRLSIYPFSDAQGTPSLRIRVGQRGQGTRTSAARRRSAVATSASRGSIGAWWPDDGSAL